jgi:hypothetical protein
MPGGLTIDEASRQAYEFVTEDVTFYDTLEIDHASFSEPVMVVNSFAQLVTGQGTFYPVQFTFVLPDTEGAVRGEMTISVQYITVEARQAIRAAATDPNEITVKYRQYIEGNLDNPDAELPTLLYVSSVTETSSGVEAKALLPDLIGQYFPRRMMTVASLPGCRL